MSRGGVAKNAVAMHGIFLRRRDARCRFSSVVYNGIRGLTCSLCGIFWRRRYDQRRDAWRRFSNVVANYIPMFICASVVFRGGVAKNGMGALGIGLKLLVQLCSQDQLW
jgi:hypothetical protein